MNKDENNKKIAEWLGWSSHDFYSPKGFFALLDGLRVKGLESDLRQKLSNNEWAVDIWIYESPSVPDIMATARHTDLPTALVEATLQAMEAE